MNKEAARGGGGDDDDEEDEVVDSHERRQRWQKCRGRPADRLDLLTGKSSRSRRSRRSRRRCRWVAVGSAYLTASCAPAASVLRPEPLEKKRDT